MTNGTTAAVPTADQQRALDELRAIAQEGPNVEILAVAGPGSAGSMTIEISLATAGAGSGPRGEQPAAHLRDRERFQLLVGRDYPFRPPTVLVPHARFADLPHVQWRRHLCLYVSPNTEWQPSDGMYGFMDRLLLWLDRAATGSLEAAGEPLHPPAALPTGAAGAIIVRVDTPAVPAETTLMVAVMRPRTPDRVEIVGWLPLAEAMVHADDPSVVMRRYGAADELTLGLAVMLAEPSGFEFPRTVADLRTMLTGHGVDNDRLIAGLSLLALLTDGMNEASRDNDEFGSVYVVIGTPMRGRAGGARHQHIAAWRFDNLGAQITSLLDVAASPSEAVRDLTPQVRSLMEKWLGFANLHWVRIYDARPQVTIRRDADGPLVSLAGRRVLLLGAGAIGTQVAAHMVRAGVGELRLVDNAKVSPGVLVRQDFVDADVDEFKVVALARRLREIDPATPVTTDSADAHDLFGDDSSAPDVDLIIDATANMALAERIERHRRGHKQYPRLINMMVGFRATRGIALVAPSGYSGAGVDLLRKTKISVSTQAKLRPFAHDFFPDPPRGEHFQPEPGCSEATFTGSNAQIAALTGTLLLHAMRSTDDTQASVTLFDLGLDAEPHLETLHLAADVTTNTAGYAVRIAPNVAREWRAEVRLMVRLRDPSVETGGVLLGEINDACRVIWISMATGPPPDSHASSSAFVCGIEGVDDLVTHHDRRTRGALRFLGLWHTHPYGLAHPSETDIRGMSELLVPVQQAPRRALLTILGGPQTWAAWREGQGNEPPDLFLDVCTRTNSAIAAHSPGADLSSALARAGDDELRRWPPPAPRPRIRRRRWWRW